MIVGTVRERKTEEGRVGLIPEGAQDLVLAGHNVLVESGAGASSGLTDDMYRQAGALVIEDAAVVWGQADLVVKVKEPQPDEFGWLRRDQTLFTYLHLAADPEVTRALLEAGTTAIAYETVELPSGDLPLLIPMSEIAGRMAPQIAARWLQHPGPGRGKLFSGMPGAPPAHIVIFGAGTVALNAIAIAMGMGARVTVVAPRLEQLRAIEERWSQRVVTLNSTPASIRKAIEGADVMISAVLVRGGQAAPKLVSRDDLKRAGPGAVIVDVAIDQGGIFETSRPTTHSEPIFLEEGVIHYCVANMPGAVPHTATFALAAATQPYVLALAQLGTMKALSSDPALAKGLMTHAGVLANKDVARSLGL